MQDLKSKIKTSQTFQQPVGYIIQYVIMLCVVVYQTALMHQGGFQKLTFCLYFLLPIEVIFRNIILVNSNIDSTTCPFYDVWLVAYCFLFLISSIHEHQKQLYHLKIQCVHISKPLLHKTQNFHHLYQHLCFIFMTVIDFQVIFLKLSKCQIISTDALAQLVTNSKILNFS